MKLTGVLNLAVVAALLAAPAYACPPSEPYPSAPVPPAGTSAEDTAALEAAWLAAHQTLRAARYEGYQLDYQRMLFSDAESIVIARITRIETRTDVVPKAEYLKGTPLVYLQPVQWLRGSGPLPEFSLGYSGRTSCGLIPGFEAMTGKVGDIYVVYSTKATIRQEDTLHVIGVGNVRDADTLALMTAPPQ